MDKNKTFRNIFGKKYNKIIILEDHVDYQNLKEKREHGKPDFRFQVIKHIDMLGNYSVPVHWHTDFEIVYVETGNMIVSNNHEEFEISEGEFCFINSNALHSVVSLTPSVHHAIIFHPSLLDFRQYDLAQLNFIQPLTSGNSKVITKILRNNNFKNLIHNLAYTDDTDYLRIKLLLYQLILDFYECELINIKNQEDHMSKIKHIITYLQSHYNTNVNLKNLSKYMGYSENYLCKHFKERTGHTIFQYLNQYRIHKSIDLLEKSDKSMLEIALDCGYESDSYYIKQFKKHMNQTPKQYRKFFRNSK